MLNSPDLISIISMVVVAVLSGLAVALYRSRTRLLRVARGNENKYRSIINAAIDGIITINTNGIVLDCNPAVEVIFGYGPQELVGRNVSMLMPEPVRGQHDSYIGNYLRTGEEKIIGIGREVEGLRKNGEIFPMDLAVSRFDWAGQIMFTGVVRDITERKKMERMKNEFVSTVSHELRTPLTSIRGALGLLRGKLLDDLPETVQELIKIADTNTERLLLLINDILDIQKMESGKMSFRIQLTEINTLVQKAVNQNLGLCEQYHVFFRFQPTTEECFADIDPDRIMQVISNLLSNAAAHSPNGGTVGVSVANTGKIVRISVSDSGPGIPEKFRPRLFKKFSQLDSTDTRATGGTGLGLAICKEIMERHDGRINFVSHPDKGTTFFVEFAGQGAMPAHSGSGVPAAANSPARDFILIVEDDQDIAGLLQRMLIEAGYRSLIAASASEAKQILNRENSRIQAITLDIMLPGQDGLSLLRELRSPQQACRIPVIIVSVKADQARRELQGAALGVIDCLDKPIDQERLRTALALAAIATNQPRILHVEDDEDIHRLVEMLLQDHSQLDHATDLSRARQLISDNHYDLCLLDIELPDGSGLDLIPLLNEQDIRIILFTAHNLSDHDASHVHSVLTKAHTANDKLLSTIEGLITTDPPAHEPSQSLHSES